MTSQPAAAQRPTELSRSRARTLIARREELLAEAASGLGVNADRNGTRARVLESATGLFARKGFDACTMRDLASAAGIKAPALYNHFRSKEQILGEAMRAALGDFIRYVLEPVEGVEPERWLGIIIRSHVLFQLERTDVAAANDLLITREGRAHQLPAADEAAIRRLQRDYFELMRDLIGAAIGGRPTPRLNVLAFAVIAMCDRTSAWFRPGGSLAPERVADETWALVEHLLTRP